MKIHEINQIEPKMIPFKCPVCSGFGTLKYGEKVCHACNGKGYVVIKNAEEREIDRYANENNLH